MIFNIYICYVFLKESYISELQVYSEYLPLLKVNKITLHLFRTENFQVFGIKHNENKIKPTGEFQMPKYPLKNVNNCK